MPLELQSAGQRAQVAVVGAAIISYDVADRCVIGTPGDDPAPMYAGAVLAPWPNRIDAGRYVWEGVEHVVPINEPAWGNALHGLVAMAEWTVLAHGDDRAELVHLLDHPGYPSRLELRVRYALGGDGLVSTVSATNVGDRPAPIGFGVHPYFHTDAHGSPRQRTADVCTLEIPASTVLQLDERMLPAGTRACVAGADFTSQQVLGARVLDDCYGGLRHVGGVSTATLTRTDDVIEVWGDTTTRWFMVYSADTIGEENLRRFLAIEPMTCAPNAFNGDDQVAVVRPGESASLTWGARLLS